MPCQDTQMKELDLDKLRGVVKSYLERHQYEAAVFWGDKVVSLSEGAPVDVYWLVQAYVLTQQYHRACLLINSYKLSKQNGTLCYLAAFCHYKVQEYQKALVLLERPEWPIVTAKCSNSSKKTGGGGGASSGTKAPAPSTESFSKPISALDDLMSLECSRQLLRAKIYEAVDNPNVAIEFYQAALLADPFCYDALKALTSHHMLTIDQEKELISSLPLEAACDTRLQAEMVTLCYQTKLNKCSVYEPSDDRPTTIPKVNANFLSLNNLPPALSSLENNLDMLTAKAEQLYHMCNFVPCFELTRVVLDQDPYHTECLPVHIACLIELQQPNVLFLLAHKLVDLYPETALAWFAVGSYYYLIGKNEHARRFLSKATTIDKVCGPAWIAFAHSFAAENEHDQASAAYFKAAQLMKGSHLPLLYIGMEYSLTKNPRFAERFFIKAIDMAPEDPFVLHELGVVNFHNEMYEAAEDYFRRAVGVVRRLYGEANNYYNIPAKWTSLLNNLGHTLRKRGKCQEALDYHYQAVRLLPSDGSTFTAIGLCLGVMGQLEAAVEALHTSLALHRDQTVATTLLNTLMEQMALTDPPFPDEEGDVIIPEYSNIAERIRIDPSMPTEEDEMIVKDTAPEESSSLLDNLMLHTDSADITDLSDVNATGMSTAATGGGDVTLGGDTADTSSNSTDMLESSSVLSVTSPLVMAIPGAAAGDRSVMSMEDMVMDEDSD